MNLLALQMMALSFHVQIKHLHSLQIPRCTRHLSMSTTPPSGQRRRRIGIIGGGASGMFAATAAADAAQRYASQGGCDVVVFEATQKTMAKVRISGGGRCNVMHDTTKPLPQILSSYPRGNKELRGMYTKRFTPDDAYEWFTSRGVTLKTESDGRMFPTTDNSQTIIDTISRAAIKAGVEVQMKEKVEGVEWREADGEGSFVVHTLAKSPDSSEKEKKAEHFDALILATGSFPIGHEIARSLGHTIVKTVPSLFTLDAKDLVKDGGAFHGLAGVSVPMARLTLTVTDEMASPSADTPPLSKPAEADGTAKKKKKRRKKAPTIVQEGPLLVTHHGVSGPAALRLSAFAAREFNAVGYKCDVNIHFCPKWEDEHASKGGSGEGVMMDALWEMTRKVPKRRVATGCPLFMKALQGEASADSPKSLPVMPKRLWSALVQHSGISPETTWGDASKTMIRSLATNISAFPLHVTSKSTFKEEFVTAGGVHLKEVQMSTMMSKKRPGLFLCGEVLDVDGVTGGFNFMNCWSTGFVSGEAAAEYCCEEQSIT
ncbi:hypothetical protein ACHAXT_007110 [Thalassiosira profunda]